jgi:hypothetical protein
MDNNSTTSTATILATTLGTITVILFVFSIFFCCLQRCLSGNYQRLKIDSDGHGFYGTEDVKHYDEEHVVHFEVVKPTVIFNTLEETNNSSAPEQQHQRRCVDFFGWSGACLVLFIIRCYS